MPRGTEHFHATDRYGRQFWEGYKATWAAPVNRIDPYTGTTYTQWEYTFNPYGPQCKRAGVYSTPSSSPSTSAAMATPASAGW